ncbi:gastric triacylglycerol lipase-like [Tribolium madens]|uniref:gastric triacylglycerol lipase-like n=1 Tax=Tribolium madens TaxID=41895 RepID=UPI001CF721FB|nr:gastric triacylglycerol lipase-like [Tribolium madens]
MKLFVLVTLVSVAFGKNLPNQNARISKMVTTYGYPLETYKVTTDDGYLLDLFRIPHGIQNKNQHDSQRPAVLLMHGFLSCCEDFVAGGPSQGLAFYLADKGYDVYLGNSRGSPYGQQHTSLDPHKDAAFWRFSFHEIGVADMAAIIDQVVSISQQNKIHYVGHMEGATVFYILASQKKGYNNKIEKMASLGPIAYLKKAPHQILKKIAENYKSKSWVIKNVGMSTFNPSSELTSEAQNQCSNLEQKEQICRNDYFLFNGYNSKNFNETTIQDVVSRRPCLGSVRQVLHLAQMKDSGRFESYTFPEKTDSYEYDLSQVSAPVAIFYTPEDALSHVDDVDALAKQLPNVYKKEVESDFTNNLDFLYAENIYKFYKYVTESFQEDQRKRNTNMLF